MADWQGSESIQQAEHISPNKTGDNIQAKRVAMYGFDGTNWQRQGIQLTPGKDYDYLSATNTDTDEDTLVFKTGGSGGTTVQTIVITYPGGADKVSDAISVVEYS